MPRFLVFNFRGFGGSELSALDALCDAVLLVFLARVDGVALFGSGVLRECGGGRKCNECGSEKNMFHVHGLIPLCPSVVGGGLFRAPAWIVLPWRTLG